MITIQWIPNPNEIADDWDDFRSDVSSYDEPFDWSIERVIAPSLGLNFAVGGRPKWAPLAAYTKKKKGHSKILWEEGTLRDAAASVNSWNIGSHEAELTKVPEYGRYQNRGFFNVMFNTPVVARQWALFQEKDIDGVVQTFVEWLEDKYN